ncbi:MAG: hypothetical protein WCL30_02270 [Pseudomonadota bacterium]
MATREQIYAALFALASNSAGFVTKGRKLIDFQDVAPSQMPALFQLQKNESYNQVGEGVPPNRTLNVELYVYASVPNDQDTPSTALNNLIDSIEAALAPNILTGNQTLGGLVSHCYIKTNIEIYDGILGQKAVAIIPIEILIP